jgi:ABC-2 type transport system ATP-binding protein
MLKIHKLQKYYGSHLALDIPELTLETGIHWVKGGNGSGKTTFFKVLAGVLPFYGEVLINQAISLKKNPIDFRRSVNFGEAEPLYPPFLTGQDLAHLYLQAKKADKKQLNDLLDRFQMQSYIHRPIGTYSSGMLKKLSLVLAFLGKPNLLLLDEPLITVDAETIPKILAWVQDFQAQSRALVLLSTHQNFSLDTFPISSVLSVNNGTINRVDL